jgi:hypothetical protein
LWNEGNPLPNLINVASQLDIVGLFFAGEIIEENLSRLITQLLFTEIGPYRLYCSRYRASRFLRSSM